MVNGFFLLTCVCVFLEYGPAMIEDIILGANLDPNMKVVTDFDTSEGKKREKKKENFYCILKKMYLVIDSPMLVSLLDSFQKGDELIESTKNVVPKGYIILLDDKSKPKTENEEEVEM